MDLLSRQRSPGLGGNDSRKSPAHEEGRALGSGTAHTFPTALYSRKLHNLAGHRAGLWENAEKSFLQALKISPKQPEVLNYLAYSWLEKKINLDKAKEMLVEAVNISKGRGYILDSLGWAYFLLKDYDKAEEILQTAYEKEPSEAVIYDHYGDVLWTNGKKIQARYVWQNAIKLKNIEQDLKESINKKIIFGLDDADKNNS